MFDMRRREFVTLLGGAAAWPLAARAQQSERVRRIGMLMTFTESDPEAKHRIAAFREALQRLGWTEGKNLRIEFRWDIDADRIRKDAIELVALGLDLIVANGPPSVLAVQHASRTMPIVFTAVSDPVAMGIVENLARPGGNATGFATAEFDMSAKWLELLKDIAPGVRRAAVLLEPSNPAALSQFVAIQTAAPALGVEVARIRVGDESEIERAVIAFARSPNGGLIVTRTAEAIAVRALIINLAAQHRLPSIYPLRFFVEAGGLVSYGPDIAQQYREAASYVDRILKGEKPADLPVQAPTKYELVINIKTAKALGLTVPDTLLARADEVIE